MAMTFGIHVDWDALEAFAVEVLLAVGGSGPARWARQVRVLAWSHR
jgi:hypothetical protein